MDPQLVERELSFFAEALPDWADGELFCVKNYSKPVHEYGLIVKDGGRFVPTVYDINFSHPRTFSSLKAMVESGWIAD